jgi:uncharacterized membrane protein (DUF4010 family)
MTVLLTAILVSACLGALVGLIRQWGDQQGAEPGEFAGVRTHTLWAVLGCLAAHLNDTFPYALAVVLVAVPAHLIARAFRPGAVEPPGSTSFAGALLTVLCGVLVAGGETRVAVVVAALTMVLLGSKQPIHAWARALTAQDVRATLQFAAISGVILPLVPDRALGPYGAFNPYTTWLMVVLISGLGFAGYAAIRVFGARAGILLTGIFGGLASSTASTLAFSRRSREEPGLDAHYALAVAAACTVMLPRVLAALTVINPAFARTLLVPFALMALPGVAYMAWVWRRAQPGHLPGDTPVLGNPLSLRTAVKFAALYALISLLVRALREQGWTEGLLPLSFVSGLTDLDAIALSVARDPTVAGARPELATVAVVLAAVANTLLKGGLALTLGSAGLRRRVALVLGLTAAMGLGWMAA